MGLFTNKGLTNILRRAYDIDNVKPIDRISIGADSTTPTVFDTDLGQIMPIHQIVIDDGSDASGWSVSGTGTGVVVNSNPGEYKYGSSSLNLEANTGTATFTKTITAIDLSNTTYSRVLLWFYVDDVAAYLDNSVSNAVRIKLGTGGLTNSNNYDWDTTQLTNGWNLLYINPANYDSQDGTGADLTNIDTIAIELTLIQDNATNNLRMDFWHYANQFDHFIREMEIGYPVADETSQLITARYLIYSNEALTYILQEVGEKNEDNELWNRDTHEPLEKTQYIEIEYELVHKICNGDCS